jgi:hypothetical protein
MLCNLEISERLSSIKLSGASSHITGEWSVNQSFKNRAGFQNIGLLSIQATDVKLV